MKEWSIRAILVAALIALGIWSWGVFFPSPEKVIRKRLGSLPRLLPFRPRKAW